MLYQQTAFARAVVPSHKGGPLSLQTKCVLATLAIYCHWDALTPYGAPLWTVAYGATMGVIALLGLTCRKPAQQTPVFGPAVLCLGSLILLGVLTMGQQSVIYPKYVLGDIARLLFPIVFLLYGRVSPDLFENPVTGKVLLAATFSAAVMAPLFSFYAQPYVAGLGSVRVTDVGRYDPPHPLLIVLLWYNVLSSASFPARIRALLLLLCAIALALFSQQRTNALLFVILGGAVLLVEYRNLVSRFSAVGPLVVTVGLVIGLSLAPFALGNSARVSERLDGILSYTRFSKLQAGSDDSVSGRFREVDDVLQTFQHSRTLPWLWGMGHGATFTPISSNPTPNITEYYDVHHIHIGVVQLWFRYGLAGVAALCLFLIALVRALWLIHVRRHSVPVMRRIWTVAMVGGVIAFLIFGTLQDPFLSLAIAGFVRRDSDST